MNELINSTLLRAPFDHVLLIAFRSVEHRPAKGAKELGNQVNAALGRIHGRRNIQEGRFVQPNKKRFTVRRIIGGGDLWITEFVLTYDGIPSYAVSIMEFRDGLVANETQYFGDRFDPAP